MISNVYAAWPFFLCMFGLLLIAASPLFKFADTPPHPTSNRVATIDGLRGFLALSVAFHHGVIYHQFILTGIWAAPPSHFYRQLGPFGVDLFFMITGYLFWTIMIKNTGRPNWLKLYTGRVFRIGPLYLFAIAAMIITLFARTGLVLHVSEWALFKSLVRAGMLGIIPLGPINAYPNTGNLLAGVTWTLKYEWYFYFSLFILAPLTREKSVCAVFPLTALAVSLIYIAFHINGQQMIVDSGAFCTALFLIGMSCASLRAMGWLAKLPNWSSSSLSLLLLLGVLTLCPTIFSSTAVILLGLTFFLIVSGCDVFGLLSTRAAIRLGNISYGIYLLQGLVFTWIFAIPAARNLATNSPSGHWLVVFVCSLLLLAFALLGHRLIEQPGIRLGQRVGNLLSGLIRKRAAGHHDMPEKTA